MSARSERFAQRAIGVIGAVAPWLAGAIALRMFTTPKRIARPEWEKKLLESGEPFRLRSGLRATVWGGKSERVVLLIHGWQGRGSQLALLAQPLVEKGFRVLAVDGPAHGDSPGRRVNVGLFADVIAAAAEELSNEGCAVHAVAHSFGASAVGLALVHKAKLRSAVLVASPSNFQKVMDLFAQRMRLSPSVKAAFEKQLAAASRLKREESDLGRSGGQVKVPVLIVHDRDDQQVGFASAESFAAHWPTARLAVLENVGHYKILKSSVFIQTVVDFVISH